MIRDARRWSVRSTQAVALEAGTKLGHYEVVASLGAGGMGEVYRALDPQLAREVAVKVLPEAVAAEPDRLTRFEREAKALAALNHPNVATIYGLEQATLDGRALPFLVMELVEGPTLAERIDQGPLDWREAARVFLEIARGLEAAHERGIVHRDLKPANVKVGVDDASGGGRVKVLDFGLAKAMAPDFASGSQPSIEDSPTLTLAATMRGEVMGTAGYMAPEQARGATVDKRADIWGFGVCLFEALTGRATFDGDTLSDKLASVLKEEPDWGLLPADVPPIMTSLLRRCLVKPAGDRMRDIGEARIALAEICVNPEAAAAAAGSDDQAPIPRGWRPLTVVAALVALALGSAAATWLLTRRGMDPSAHASVNEVQFSIGTADGGSIPDVGSVLISPDGRWVVYAGSSTESGASLLVGRDVGDEPLRARALDAPDDSTRALTGTEGALYPFFSPDSQSVGFFRGGGGVRTLYRVSLESGSILPITAGTHPGYRADWGEDGMLVMGEQRGSLRRIDAANGTLEEHFTRVDSADGELAHTHPEILPGGRGVVFTALEVEESSTRIRVWDARSGEVKTLVPRGGEARYLASGHLLYGLAGTLLLVDFDLESLTTVGDSRVVVQGVATGSMGEAFFDVSDNGTLVYMPGAAQQSPLLSLVWVGQDGTVEEELARGDFHHAQISRDGRRWLVRSARSELALFEQGAPLPQRFRTEIPVLMQPLLSEATGTVLYGAQPTGANEAARLFRLDLATGSSSPMTGLLNGRLMPVELDATRGEVIGVDYQLTDTGALSSDLLVGDLRGEAPSRGLVVGPAVVTGARLSANADRLAYTELTDAAAQVSTLYVSDYPEMSRRLPISETMVDTGYAWGPDGRLWFAEQTDNTMRVVSFTREPDLQVSSIDIAFDVEPFWPERGFAIAPDGRLLMIRGTREIAGLSGRIRVIVGWTRDRELEAGSG